LHASCNSGYVLGFAVDVRVDIGVIREDVTGTVRTGSAVGYSASFDGVCVINVSDWIIVRALDSDRDGG
jgi:hypothetical protein